MVGIITYRISKRVTAPKYSEIIRSAMVAISNGQYGKPTWANDQEVVDGLISSLKPIANKFTDAAIAEEWLTGYGTIRDILTFAQLAEAAGVSYAQQVGEIATFIEVLMSLESGGDTDDDIRIVDLFVCHILKNKQAELPWEISKIYFEPARSAFYRRHVDEDDQWEGGRSLVMFTRFRGKPVVVSLMDDDNEDAMYMSWFHDRDRI